MRVMLLGIEGTIGGAIKKELSLNPNYMVEGISRKDIDCGDYSQVAELFSARKFDIVINCVGKVAGVQGNINNSFSLASENAISSVVIAKAAYELGVNKLIYFAPACVYPVSMSTNALAEVDIWQGAPELSSRAYASAKLLGTELVRTANAEKELNWRVIIPTNLFGYGDWRHGEDGHVISMLSYRFLQAKKLNEASVTIWGTGKSKRDFLSTTDLARFINFFLKNYNVTEEVTNIPGYGEVEIIELAQIIADIVGYTGEIRIDPARPEGAQRKILSDETFKKLGFKFERSLKEALNDYVLAHSKTIFVS